jgi:hypothetical protein
MNWLKKLWNAVREPIEEAAKAALGLVVDPVIDDPRKLSGTLPEAIRDDYLRWVATPEGAVMSAAILRAAKDLALRGVEQINPND